MQTTKSKNDVHCACTNTHATTAHVPVANAIHWHAGMDAGLPCLFTNKGAPEKTLYRYMYMYVT